MSMLFFISLLLGQWEPDVRLTYDSLYSSQTINNEQIPVWTIATGPGENVHVFWVDMRAQASGRWTIYYKRSTDGGTTWGPDTLLSFGGLGTGTFEPCVAVSDSTIHLLFWSDRNIGYLDIYYKRSTNSGTIWEPDTRFTNSTGFDDMYMGPAIAVSDSNVYAVWQIGDPLHSLIDSVEIYFKRSTDGGITWGSVANLSNSYPKFSSDPAVVASGDTIHVVWAERQEWGVYDDKIYYKQSTNGGMTWGQATQLVYNPSSSNSGLKHPCIAFSDQNLHVVWDMLQDGEFEIYYKRSTDGGTTWGADTLLSDVPDWSLNSCLAVSGSNVHVVWEDARHEYLEIYYKRSIDGGMTWEADTRLTNATITSALPQIALLGPSVQVVWTDYRDDPQLFYNPEIYYKRNPTGNVYIMEDDRYQIIDDRFKISPNPFVFHTRVLGYEKETFVLYNIFGRRVGICKGNKVGADLSPGVYFLFPRDETVGPVKVIKSK